MDISNLFGTNYLPRNEEGKIDKTAKIKGEDLKAAAQEMGITLQDGAVDEAKEYSFEEANKILMQYAASRDFISTAFNKQSTGSKEDVIADLKAKYGTDEVYNGDKFTMDNPQMKKFQEFMNSGEMAALGKEFNRDDVIDIVSQVFPDIGIEGGENGAYSVPYGHDTTAKEVYTQFVQQLSEASASSPEIVALEDELNRKTVQLNENINTIQSLAQDVEKLKLSIEQKVEDAKNECRKKEEQLSDEAKDAVKKAVDDFANSNGEMTYSQFQNNVQQALGALNVDAELKSATDSLLSAEKDMAQIQNIVKQIGVLNESNAQLRVDIGSLNEEIALKKAEEAAKSQELSSRTDPIGFKTADGARIDFFMDTDGDGALSNEMEFLGASNGWAEMEALNTNGDSVVDYEELKNAQNLKVVVTGADGTQTVKDIAEVFKEGDSIDLSSYAADGNKMDGTNNILAGTFNLNFGGENLQGYNTLDTLDYLDENYEFSDKDKGIGRFAKGSVSGLTDAQEIMASSFDPVIAELENKLTQAWSDLGIDRNEIKDKIKAAYDASAKMKAQQIADDFNNNGGDTVNPPAGETQPAYDKYDENEWENQLSDLKLTRSTSKRDEIRNALMSKLRNSNFSPSDTKTLLSEIRKASSQAVDNDYLEHFFSNKDDLVKQWNAYEQEAKELAELKGIEYEIEEKVFELID